MKVICEFSDKDLGMPAPAAVDRSDYAQREAARAVVTDADGRVALLHVTKYGYYKLPGGGIDAGESVVEALLRELMEEIGCKADITGEIGRVIEYRDQKAFRQTSYAYAAVQAGEQQVPEFTDKELGDGFEMVWAADLDDAIELVASARHELYEARHIQYRDLIILKSML